MLSVKIGVGAREKNFPNNSGRIPFMKKDFDFAKHVAINSESW